MSPLSVCATVLVLGWHSVLSAQSASGPTLDLPPATASATNDSVRAAPQPVLAVGVLPVALTRSVASSALLPQDTVRRRKAVEYSDAYYKRLTLHKALSWAMLPLFAVSYVSGDQLLAKGDAAPGWAQSIHPVAATSTAVLFGANAITGGWNLWDGRKDPIGRKRRLLHSALFLAASGGFAYAGSTLADEAEESASKRRDHRNLALASMSVSTASWLIMLIGN